MSCEGRGGGETRPLPAVRDRAGRAKPGLGTCAARFRSVAAGAGAARASADAGSAADAGRRAGVAAGAGELVRAGAADVPDRRRTAPRAAVVAVCHATTGRAAPGRAG